MYDETPTKKLAVGEDKKPEVLYHMTEKAVWEATVKAGEAYYPLTYEQVDGFYTHATAVPSRLIMTANHRYQIPRASGSACSCRARR